MRNNLKTNLYTDNKYLDLEIINKFESFEDYPNTKPVLIADSDGIVLFVNNSLTKTYKIKEGFNLFELESEPKFSKLFFNLIETKNVSFCCDLLIKRDDDSFESYILNI